MIVAAALCPAPPLLVRELTGAGQVAADLRAACLAAAAELAAAAPQVIVVIGTADQTAMWPASGVFDLAAFAPPRHARPGGPPPDGLPAPLGIGTWLLTSAGYEGARVLRSVGRRETAGRCADIGADLAGARERVALLAMADGSARRTLKAPGYLDERSAGFDAAVENAVRSGQLDRLLSVDEGLADELMATGRPAWQVLAGALRGRKVASDVRYCDDPFGVAYLVASLRVPDAAQEGDRGG